MKINKIPTHLNTHLNTFMRRISENTFRVDFLTHFTTFLHGSSSCSLTLCDRMSFTVPCSSASLLLLDTVVLSFRGQTLTQHRKVAVAFRDKQLQHIFVLAIAVLRQLFTETLKGSDGKSLYYQLDMDLISKFTMPFAAVVSVLYFRAIFEKYSEQKTRVRNLRNFGRNFAFSPSLHTPSLTPSTPHLPEMNINFGEQFIAASNCALLS